jgi:hypothetical protein
VSWFRRKWFKYFSTKKISHHHEVFVPNLPGRSIKALQESDVSQFSRAVEFDRNGNYQSYIVRNPKTGTVIVVKDTIANLKIKYPNHEVVEPIIR